MSDHETNRDDFAVLGGFLSEPARKVRRVLLALGTVAVALRVFGIHVQTISLLGTTIQIAEERWLPLGLLVATVYFAVLFAVYAGSDIHRHNEPIARIARMLPLSPADSLNYRNSRTTAAVLLSARVILEGNSSIPAARRSSPEVARGSAAPPPCAWPRRGAAS
jgi:hypothetical protein